MRLLPKTAPGFLCMVADDGEVPSAQAAVAGLSKLATSSPEACRALIGLRVHGRAPVQQAAREALAARMRKGAVEKSGVMWLCHDHGHATSWPPS